MTRVNIELMRSRKPFVYIYGCRLPGDSYLEQDDEQGYINWVLANPDKAPHGMVVQEDEHGNDV
jgi:hypothetical protein